MKDYKVVGIFWQDHTAYSQVNPKSLSIKKALRPTLSIGLVFKETENEIVLISSLERYANRDEADFMIILKGTILSMKEYGTIELRKI